MEGMTPECLLEINTAISFMKDDLWFTDPNFFKVFDFPLSQGDPETAFLDPYSVVITEAVAQKYFGEQSPMGQILSFNDKAFKVTGVLKVTTHNSHFPFDLLASPIPPKPNFWFNHEFYTYLLLQQNDSAGELEAKLPDFIERHAGKEYKAF